ncbi:MAG: CDP-diacylglycerol--glycerol-3-phosphate 3-phosphatidyltransferase [Clostridia bacterium]|nr:CDP-diacylglycerol--glycerol-3-phosphate 3-phosphatidyltransferase [Clostridia bacterium]
MNLPNKLTLSRIFIVPVFMIFVIPFPDWVVNSGFAHEQLVAINNFIISKGNFIAAVLFILAASTDGVDGYIARKRKQITRFGKFLDPIADKLLVTAALIALVERGDLTGWAAMLIISREFIVTGLRLIAAGEGIVISASNLGKIKTITQMIAIVATLLKNWPLALFTDIQFDRYFMMIAVIITVYSGYDYLAKNIKVIRHDE